MKPLKAYAIVDSDDKLECWNHKVPIYWRRSVAHDACKENCNSDSKVIAVQIIPIEQRKPATKGKRA